MIGRETVGRVLLRNTLFQPVIAALIGLIPNCAASVILTELYLDGVISFGAAVSGLSAGAGLGLLVLWRVHPDRQEALRITGLLLMTAIVSGTVLSCPSLGKGVQHCFSERRRKGIGGYSRLIFQRSA